MELSSGVPPASKRRIELARMMLTLLLAFPLYATNYVFAIKSQLQAPLSPDRSEHREPRAALGREEGGNQFESLLAASDGIIEAAEPSASSAMLESRLGPENKNPQDANAQAASDAQATTKNFVPSMSYDMLKQVESPLELYQKLGITPPAGLVWQEPAPDEASQLLETKTSSSHSNMPQGPGLVQNENAMIDKEAALENKLLSERHQKEVEANLEMQGKFIKKKKAAQLEQEEFHELPFADQLYLKLNSIFGNTDTLLTMEWPGRVLDMESFYYEIHDAYSQFLKPVAVRDAEFSLADELYYPVQITGGPTGTSLATMYKMVLDELTESTDWPSDAFQKRRDQIIKLLNKEYPGPKLSLGTILDIDFLKEKMTLREIHEWYIKKYLTVRSMLLAKLNKIKNKARLTVTSKPGIFANTVLDGLIGDSYAENKNEELMAKDALMDQIPILNDEIHLELNQAWKDLIIEGRHHEVMSMLSILDVASPGELLQETKDRMRNTGQSSLDGTEVTYPVTFQPANWAQSLTTKFVTRDLLMEPDNVMMEIAELEEQKRSALMEMASLTELKTGDVVEAKKRADAAKKNLDAARDNVGILQSLFPQYALAADAVTVVAEAVCKKVEDCVEAGEVTEQFTNGLKMYAPTSVAIAAIDKPPKDRTQQDMDVMSQLSSTLSNFISARQVYAQTAGEFQDAIHAETMAKATDFTGRQQTLGEHIRQLEYQIKSKQAMLTGIKNRVVNASTEPMTPVGSASAPWIDIIFKTSASSATRSSKISGSTSFSESSGGIPFIFRTDNSATKSEESDTASAQSFEEEWQIGFSATKVAMDRGGWFKPEIMQHSSMFMKTGNLGGKKIALGRPPGLGDLAQNTSNMTALLDVDWERYKQCLFPSFPLAFIVVRDVTIKMSFTEAMSKSEEKSRKESVKNANSILGFSTAAGKSTENGFKGSSNYAKGHHMIVKIPGPQILAWIQRFIAEDKCEIAGRGLIGELVDGVKDWLKERESKKSYYT
eukprot:g72191.t1